MSLINKMLQELEARPANPAETGELHREVRAAALPPARRSLPWMLAALALAGAAATGYVAWQRLAGPPVQPGTMNLPPELSLKISAALLAVEPAPLEPLPAAEVAGTAAGIAAGQLAATGPGTMPVVQAALAPAVAAAPSPGATSSLPRPAPPAQVPAVVEAPNERAAPKEPTPRQQAENEYKRGGGLAQQGRSAESIAAFELALKFDPGHVPARQSLASQLVEAKRLDEAMQRLQEGLDANRANGSLAMMLARIQLDRGETKAAIDTLGRSLPYDRERPEYHAFMAGLLQKENRHREAIDYYLNALRKAPQNGVWWMGIGISLQAENRVSEAREAFSRAQAAGGLSAELKAFVQQRLEQLR
ncbi:tetratricopeptide repeat protein [Lacisediminimonas profundi]|uniref:tetratricopeptide repeat protein n=1 Tax=Lacisediminimonas profundi TaxID=2603856 RepID=UPI00124AF977|nr:tetratricopeptide repeat protein [Lacisediminimonas profundi]